MRLFSRVVGSGGAQVSLAIEEYQQLNTQAQRLLELSEQVREHGLTLQLATEADQLLPFGGAVVQYHIAGAHRAERQLALEGIWESIKNALSALVRKIMDVWRALVAKVKSFFSKDETDQHEAQTREAELAQAKKNQEELERRLREAAAHAERDRSERESRMEEDERAQRSAQHASERDHAQRREHEEEHQAAHREHEAHLHAQAQQRDRDDRESRMEAEDRAQRAALFANERDSASKREHDAHWAAQQREIAALQASERAEKVKREAAAKAAQEHREATQRTVRAQHAMAAVADAARKRATENGRAALHAAQQAAERAKQIEAHAAKIAAERQHEAEEAAKALKHQQEVAETHARQAEQAAAHQVRHAAVAAKRDGRSLFSQALKSTGVQGLVDLVLPQNAEVKHLLTYRGPQLQVIQQHGNYWELLMKCNNSINGHLGAWAERAAGELSTTWKAAHAASQAQEGEEFTQSLQTACDASAKLFSDLMPHPPGFASFEEVSSTLAKEREQASSEELLAYEALRQFCLGDRTQGMLKHLETAARDTSGHLVSMLHAMSVMESVVLQDLGRAQQQHASGPTTPAFGHLRMNLATVGSHVTALYKYWKTWSEFEGDCTQVTRNFNRLQLALLQELDRAAGGRRAHGEHEQHLAHQAAE